MNKKLTTFLASSIAATSQAAFDPGAAILFAYDPSDDDTYFIDTGVTAQDLVNGAVINGNSAGLASWLASNSGSVTWTLLGTINDPSPVAGPPAINKSLANSGIVSSSTSGTPVGLTGTDNENQRVVLNAWIADIKAVSGGLSEFALPGFYPESANQTRNISFFNDSGVAIDTVADLFYAQADPSTLASISNPTVTTPAGRTGDALSGSSFVVSANGNFSIIPVPAAAWLFLSACGALLARSKAATIGQLSKRKT